jgi:hypothetical protein
MQYRQQTAGTETEQFGSIKHTINHVCCVSNKHINYNIVYISIHSYAKYNPVKTKSDT